MTQDVDSDFNSNKHKFQQIHLSTPRASTCHVYMKVDFSVHVLCRLCIEEVLYRYSFQTNHWWIKLSVPMSR